MKLAALLLITVSLVVGVVGAVTAYLPPLSLPDEALVTDPPLTLNAPAGERDGEPIAPGGAALTPEVLAELRAAEVKRVRVREFSLARWPEWWLFVLGCVGLGVGAVIVRRENRRAMAAAGAARGGAGAGPEEALATLKREIERLRAELPGMGSEGERLAAIVERVGEQQRTTIPAFIAARPVLVSRLGLAGFARLMDSFAAAERQINRAWSAAADEVEAEAVASLERAVGLLGEAEGRLGGRV